MATVYNFYRNVQTNAKLISTNSIDFLQDCKLKLSIKRFSNSIHFVWYRHLNKIIFKSILKNFLHLTRSLETEQSEDQDINVIAHRCNDFLQ